MKLIFSRRGHLCALICGVLASVSAVVDATTITVSPATITNNYSGSVTIQINGLTNGETVLIERFIDINGNGVIDAEEPRVQSLLVTDGQLASIGGVRNTDVPDDNDAVINGQIKTALSFANSPEFSRGSGAQIFRVSSPTGRFAAAQQVVTIVQPNLPQKITGTVTSAGSPLANAWVAALVQVGTDQILISATTADSSGKFALGVTNGTYQVLGFKFGYTGNFGTSPAVTVSGVDTNILVPLTAGNLSLSGTVSDSISGSGVAGVQFFATSANNDYLVFFSDAQGDFSPALISGQWKLEVSDSSAMLGGYLRSQNKPKVTVGTTNVTGVNVSFTKATAMIYGTLKTDQGTALAGVRLYGSDSANLLQSTAYTDTNGQFVLPVSATTWYFGVDQGSSLPSGYLVNQDQLTLAAGQAVQANLVATRATAYLVGRATDSNNNPIGSGSMIAFAATGPNQTGQLANDGTFVVPVTGGSWSLSLDTQAAASQNLVPPQFQFTVTDGVNISNIVYVAPIATRMISGSVKTSTNTPVSGLNLYAGTVLNGTNFNANANTDANGNYSLAVLPGMWVVGLDSQSLSQRGYPAVASQNVDTTSGNQTANFVVGGQPIGSIWFRENMGVVGQFGASSTPMVTYPVSPKNYRVLFHVFNDTNPPAASAVFFTGPAGSGLTNTAADPVFGVVQDGTNVYYASPAIKSPAAAPGGAWTVVYKSIMNTFTMPDPQVSARIAVPLPTVARTNGTLNAISWAYKDPNGNTLPGTPGFIVTNRVDLFDQNGNPIDTEVFPTAPGFTYPSTNPVSWANIGLVRTGYFDSYTNQYFFSFSESSPTLTGAGLVSGHTWQFLLNGAPAQNYTVQFTTALGSGTWTTLYVTNGAVSPFTIVDPGATNAARFYRILVGP